jgi:hypothetical protein
MQPRQHSHSRQVDPERRLLGDLGAMGRLSADRRPAAERLIATLGQPLLSALRVQCGAVGIREPFRKHSQRRVA